MVLGESESSEAVLLAVTTLLLFIGVFSALFALGLHLRNAKRLGKGAEDEQWIGHGFDSTGVAPRLQALRRDYVSELRARPHTAGHSPGRLATARELVARLPYFSNFRGAEEALPEEPSSQVTRHASIT